MTMRYGDPHREHMNCCYHCDGREYICHPCWKRKNG